LHFHFTSRIYALIIWTMGDKRPILVVDDEPGILKILSIQLKHDGYEVITTTSGEEAVELVREKDPSLILLDILMPGVTGLEVLDRIRAFSQVPVIIFTANNRVVEAAMKRGANGSIPKPFTPESLLEKIQSVLGSHND